MGAGTCWLSRLSTVGSKSAGCLTCRQTGLVGILVDMVEGGCACYKTKI